MVLVIFAKLIQIEHKYLHYEPICGVCIWDLHEYLMGAILAFRNFAFFLEDVQLFASFTSCRGV